MSRHRFAFVLAATAALLSFSGVTSADPAKGTVVYQGKTAKLEHVYLVKGPDAVDTAMTIRELVFSSTDLGPKIQACKTMSCVSGEVTDGMTVDLDAGPRLNYWVALNGQRVQYSGTAKPAVLQTTADEATKLAGTLRIDDTTAGGAKVEVQFDAKLLKEFQSAR
jgi:hypothetical protein